MTDLILGQPSTYSAPATAAPVPLWAAITMAIAAGGLLALAYALHPVWWAAWLAPTPVLAVAVVGPARRVHLLGAVAGLTAGVTTLSYYIKVATPTGALAIFLSRGLFWSAAIAFAARAAHRLPAPAAVFALPLFASAVELIVTLMSPYAGDGSLAHSQMDALPVIQVASLGGAPAIVFVVLCGGSLMGLFGARLMGAALSPGSLTLAAALVLAVEVSAVAFGIARLSAPPAERSLPVFTVSTDHFRTRPTSWAQVWSAYGPAVSAVARAGAVVVAPEKVALLSPEDARSAALQLSALARSRGASLVIGLETRDETGRYRNRALVATPDGGVHWYDKQRLVPGLEARDTPGARPLVLTVGGTKVGVAICKDMHAPDLGRAYGRLGAQVMVVPAFDFGRDGWLSDRLTALRGVESGYTIVRATRSGVSSISDRTGRIVAEMVSSAEGVVTLAGRAPVREASTLYRRVGDVVGWLSLLATVVLGLAMSRRRPAAAKLEQISRLPTC
jgi:apolipoprotein N-acyltransferase